MTPEEIAEPLVTALMNGTKDAATLQKIKEMGNRLERRIKKYAVLFAIDELKKLGTPTPIKYIIENQIYELETKIQDYAKTTEDF